MDFTETNELIGYAPYTREFDVIADVERVFKPERLSELAQSVSRYRTTWSAYEKVTSLVDSLPEVFGQAMEARGLDARDTTVLFLIDGSGSTRGATAMHIATATIEACIALEEIGVEASVLGYTTTTWKGGASRKQWLEDGKPRDPGRLCDLLHIVYKTPAMDAVSSLHRLCALAADESKKENVDGEALIWASDCIRLLDRPNKIIVNVTDGFFPIDDSTIYSNSTNPLTLHMAAVCDAIEEEGVVSLSRVYVDLNDEHANARQKLRDDGMTIFQRDAVTTEIRDVAATLDAVVEGIELGFTRAAELSFDLEEAQALGPRL
jgi:cobaltochelatase CobT